MRRAGLRGDGVDVGDADGGNVKRGDGVGVGDADTSGRRRRDGRHGCRAAIGGVRGCEHEIRRRPSHCVAGGNIGLRLSRSGTRGEWRR